MNLCNRHSLIRTCKFSIHLSFMQTSIPVLGVNQFEPTSTNAPFLLFFASSIKYVIKPKSTHRNNPNHSRKVHEADSKKSNALGSGNMKNHTPEDIEFEKWTQNLQRGFQPEDVAEVLKQETIDVDLAFDIFRWASQQRRYKHNHLTYQLMIQKLASATKLNKMEILIDEVMGGACEASQSLLNTLIHLCIQARWLGRAINIYKHMRKSSHAKPSLKTYNLLLSDLATKDNNNNSYISHMYMQNMRALFKQMVDANVAPDVFTLNMMIKGYTKSMHVNDALRIFHQMEDFYGCTPDAHTYNYLIRGLCLQSRTINAMEFYREMISKEFVPTNMVYNSLVNSLSLAGELEEATRVLREMIDRVGVPDFITYKTLVEGLCRQGKGLETSQLLREFRLKDRALDGISYRKLLNHCSQ